jgi:hypothetical protein
LLNSQSSFFSFLDHSVVEYSQINKGKDIRALVVCLVFCRSLYWSFSKHITKDDIAFDLIVSDLAEPILGHPNFTELSYQSCNNSFQMFLVLWKKKKKCVTLLNLYHALAYTYIMRVYAAVGAVLLLLLVRCSIFS